MSIKSNISIIVSVILLSNFSSTCFATTESSISTYVPAQQGGQVVQKLVRLMPLSKETQMKINARHRNSFNQYQANNSLPSKVIIPMDNVPVLDQSNYGSCVTFAFTAALDSLIGKGDYISQLCALQMGRYLEEDSYGQQSGWDGIQVLQLSNRLSAYGIVNKQLQIENSCGGVNEYPSPDQTNDEASIPGQPMTLDDYNKMSEDLAGREGYKTGGYLKWWVNEAKYDNKVEYADVEKVKELLAINVGKPVNHRVLVGFEIPADGSEGRYTFLAQHNVPFDTWVLPNGATWNGGGGHEVIIYGYDDNATAIDANGRVYKGLFMVRNSWGTTFGDQGNYYMSYDYFTQFENEIVVLHYRQ